MRSFHGRSVIAALGLVCLAGIGRAQDAGVPSLLPLPPLAPIGNSYDVVQTVAKEAASWYADPNPPTTPVAPGGDNQRSPSDRVISPEPASPMKGATKDSCAAAAECSTCDTCCNCRYFYANGLIMGRASVPNVPTSIDTDPSSVLNTNDIQGKWIGGFEIGMGRCFNDNQNALEFVYWGLFPNTESANFVGASALGALDPSPSMEFDTLNYSDGWQTGTAFIFFEDAELHQIESSYSVNSIEVNMLGTGGCRGPFGCGALGCGPASCGCSPWGVGWIAGFRYFSFDENLLFRTDDVNTIFDGGDGELNYDLQTRNDLYGFQLGGGLNRCIGEKLSLYSIGKVGVFANDSSMQQAVYGSSGFAVINTGNDGGQDYNITASKTSVAMVAQFDLGLRYQINGHWSTQLGYRAVGVSGVALTAHSIAADFSDLPTVRNYDVSGSVLLHGGYFGATYAW